MGSSQGKIKNYPAYQHFSSVKERVIIPQKRCIILENCEVERIHFPQNLRPGFVIVDYTSSVGGKKGGLIESHEDPYASDLPGVCGGLVVPVVAISRPWRSFQSIMRERVASVTDYLAEYYRVCDQYHDVPRGEIYLKKAPSEISGTTVLLDIKLTQDITIHGDVVLLNVDSADSKIKYITARNIYYFRSSTLPDKIDFKTKGIVHVFNICVREFNRVGNKHSLFNWIDEHSLVVFNNFSSPEVTFESDRKDNIAIIDSTVDINKFVNTSVIRVFATHYDSLNEKAFMRCSSHIQSQA